MPFFLSYRDRRVFFFLSRATHFSFSSGAPCFSFFSGAPSFSFLSGAQGFSFLSGAPCFCFLSGARVFLSYRERRGFLIGSASFSFGLRIPANSVLVRVSIGTLLCRCKPFAWCYLCFYAVLCPHRGLCKVFYNFWYTVQYLQVLRIRITLMRIRIRLLSLMRMRIRSPSS